MGSVAFYFRKMIALLRGEVLVLPSRTIVALFIIVLLGLPLITQDPYIVRIIILTSIFAILASGMSTSAGTPSG